MNAEYDSIEEGETVVRTVADYWVVCRKTAHRRFFVVVTQKSANFAEVTGQRSERDVHTLTSTVYITHAPSTDDVRKLCQREFTNIFFLD